MPGLDGAPQWPDWCWLPMSAPASIVQATPHADPADVGRLAAVAQWRLTGRHIVSPDEEVAQHAIPGALDTNDPATTTQMDVTIPREHLLKELERACYYIVSPLQRPADHDGMWLYGVYTHLEFDLGTHRTELRMLADTGDEWDSLLPTFVHADLPTLAWSTRDIAAQAGDTLAEFARVITWWAWPLVMTLLDHNAHLVGPAPIDTTGLPKTMHGAHQWTLTYRSLRGI